MLDLDYSIKTYVKSEVVSFFKVNEPFGGLSNMDGKNFPLKVNGIHIRSSEALYQACRFPNYPEIQKKIIDCKSPMEAKMISKKYRSDYTRPDFEEIKVDIMYWCLQVKLACNFQKFSMLLKSTGTKPIVEISRKDDFWGAKVNKQNDQELVGKNILGQLLYKLNKECDNFKSLSILSTPIQDFKLLSSNINSTN
jgi:type I restriction enzyme S subunit